MADEDRIKISALAIAEAIDTYTIFPVSITDAQSSTGYSSRKVSFNELANFLVGGYQSASLDTTAKTVVGAINEVASDKNLADTYDNTATYEEGDYVIYNTTLYVCNTDILVAEDWDSTHWDAVQITDLLGGGGGSSVAWTQITGTGTQIATITIDGVSTAVYAPTSGGSAYTDVTGTLSAGSTSLTLQDASITTSSTLDFYTDVFGVNPTNVVVTTGQVVLTFEAQQVAVNVKVRVW